MSSNYSYSILSEGKALGTSMNVQHLVVFNDINRIPNAKIILRDGDVSAQKFMISSGELFKPGKQIEIFLGSVDKLNSVFKGIVVNHALKVADGTSILEVVCKHPVVHLTTRKTNHIFRDSTDLDAIYSLLNEHQIEFDKCDLDSLAHEQLVHYDSYAWDFICARAEANGFLLYFDNHKLKIGRPEPTDKETFVCEYGNNVLQFYAQLNGLSQYDKVESKSWSAAEQQVTTATATASYINNQGNISSAELSDLMKQTSYELFHSGNLPAPELQSWAMAKANKSSMSKTTGNIKVLGTILSQTGKTMKLSGFGDRFNGLAMITGVRHEFYNGSWTVDIQFGLSDQWFAQRQDFNALPASGLLPAIAGLQVATVLELQGDPEGESRIKIKIPLVEDTEDGIWAKIVQLYAGNHHGTFFLPEIGDEVIVGFLNSDPRSPVVVGAVYSSSNPGPANFSNDNHQKGIVSRSNISLKFDEEKKSIKLSTPGGYVISINEQEKKIEINDANHNNIMLDPKGITMKSVNSITISSDKDVIIEGINVQCKAKGNLHLEGSAGTKMASSGLTAVTGSLVTIN